MASPVARREKTVRRHRARLSGRPDARLPLPSDNRNARRAWFRIPRVRPSAHRSRLARSFPGLAASRRKGRRGAIAAAAAQRRACATAESKNREQGAPPTAALHNEGTLIEPLCRSVIRLAWARLERRPWGKK